MSMQTITYLGYGIDLGEYRNENPDLEHAMRAIIDNEQTDDWNFDHYNDKNSKIARVITSCNNDNWETLIYIPAIIPVASVNNTIKTYLPKEAQDLFIQMIKQMFTEENIINDIWSDRSPAEKLMLMTEFNQSIEDFVHQNAGYSYDHDWSDLV